MVASQVSWWRTSFGDDEIRKLAEAVSEEHISQGPVTAEFEARIAESLDVPHAVVTTSGSVALFMALTALGIGPGDEVIVPDRTWVATAHAVLLTGAQVVLVDVLPDIPALDTSKISQKITPQTKAILPVHLNGRSVDMAAIHQIADEFELHVVEDACQALYSRNADGYLGTQSDAGCFSLGVTKLVSTGQGGFVVTHSEETAKNLRLVRNHGVVDNFTDTWDQMGFNFKFTDLLASFGIVQVSKRGSRIVHVHEIYEKYMAVLPEFDFLRPIPVNTLDGEVPLYMEAQCDQRDELVDFLNSEGVQTRPFPPSLHTSSYFGNSAGEHGDEDHSKDFPHSVSFAQRGLFLPCGPEQPLENLDRVIEALARYSRRGMAASS